MKNLINRTKVALAVLGYLGFALFINSCKDDDTPPDCGCESETIDTVPSENFPEVSIEEQKGGVLLFITPGDTRVANFFDPDGQYDNHFWIVRNNVAHYIICNETLLGTEYNYLKNTGGDIPVNFEGRLKRLCIGKLVIAPTEYSFYGIELISIEKR